MVDYLDPENMKGAAYAGGALTILSGMVYQVLKLLRQDRRQDRRDDRREEVADTVWERVHQLEAWGDALGKERNEIAATAAILSAEVTVLRSRLALLTEHINAIEVERDALRRALSPPPGQHERRAHMFRREPTLPAELTGRPPPSADDMNGGMP